jgi:hypothetical protein
VNRAVMALLLGVLSLLGGCFAEGSGGSREAARPLTVEEAERLSLFRFVNYQRGRGAVEATVPSGGRHFRLTARVDWISHSGYGHVDVEGQPRFLVRWNLATITVRPGWSGDLPEPPPADGWTARPIDAKRNPIDATLLLVLNLGADRPENAQLLRQSDARWLGVDRIGEVPVMVVAGPSRTPGNGTAGGRIRYWVDPDAMLRRISAPLGTTGATVTLDLPEHPVPPVPPLPQ